MEKKYLKKIIAQSPDDLHVISACCADAKIKVTDIKYLPSTKIFLLYLSRFDKENDDKKSINSILKFEFVDSSKSKNIDQDNPKLLLRLIAIDIFKREHNFEIIFLFSENRLITLTCEVIEATLEDQKYINDKSTKL
tara:strand:- start:1510 stop:1920 length:411 start_codon:yes stop_codon:yes gene_type:complete